LPAPTGEHPDASLWLITVRDPIAEPLRLRTPESDARHGWWLAETVTVAAGASVSRFAPAASRSR
jgi:hypothetical protein